MGRLLPLELRAPGCSALQASGRAPLTRRVRLFKRAFSLLAGPDTPCDIRGASAAPSRQQALVHGACSPGRWRSPTPPAGHQQGCDQGRRGCQHTQPGVGVAGRGGQGAAGGRRLHHREPHAWGPHAHAGGRARQARTHARWLVPPNPTPTPTSPRTTTLLRTLHHLDLQPTAQLLVQLPAQPPAPSADAAAFLPPPMPARLRSRLCWAPSCGSRAPRRCHAACLAALAGAARRWTRWSRSCGTPASGGAVGRCCCGWCCGWGGGVVAGGWLRRADVVVAVVWGVGGRGAAVGLRALCAVLPCAALRCPALPALPALASGRGLLVSLLMLHTPIPAALPAAGLATAPSV
jgi:hypothetical protein